jgi:hypothetical protein
MFMPLYAGNGHNSLIYTNIQYKQSRRSSNGDTIFCVRVICFLLNIFYWLTRRYARLFIRIEDKGMTASTYFGPRHAAWEDIIALRDWVPFRGLGFLSDFFAADFTLYKIYTHNHMISFSSSMPGADELAKLISEAAGLDWT